MTYFPERQYADGGTYAQDYFAQLSKAYATVDPSAVAAAGQLLIEASKAKRTIFSCGNGGSAAIANHLVCDCLKGARSGSSLMPRVHSLSSNIELLTALANDFGVEHLFSFPLESVADANDVLITISSSGTSPNIVKVLQTARSMGLKTIAMSGFSGGASRDLADVSLHVDAENYGVIEDTHQSLMHILAQYLRNSHITDASTLGSVKF